VIRLFPAAVLLGGVLLSGCTVEQPGTGPAEDLLGSSSSKPQGPVGRIRGIVRFEGDPPPPRFDPITENQDVCGDRALLPRLDLGEGGGVRNAFVYLDGIDRSPQVRPREHVLIDQRDCEYVPHSLVAPVGSQVDVTNSDAILHNVHGRADVGSGMQTIFNIAQPIQGQRTTINSPLSEPGIVAMTCEAGHPWMSAHIFVAEHPYVAVTDDAGAFVIDDVPPGTYEIKMWHEGVRLERIVRSLERYDYEEPYEITQSVTVEADAESVVNFEMTLRPAE
jgi:plastocyanin